MKINPKWYPDKTISQEEKDKYAATIRSSTTGLRRLRDIVREEVGILKTPTTKSDYMNAGWPYYEADRQGQIKAYEKLLNLLEFINDR